MPGDNLDSQSVQTDVNGTVGRSMHLKRNNFPSFTGWDSRDTTAVQFITCNSDQIDCPLVKVRFFLLLAEVLIYQLTLVLQNLDQHAWFMFGTIKWSGSRHGLLVCRQA